MDTMTYLITVALHVFVIVTNIRWSLLNQSWSKRNREWAEFNSKWSDQLVERHRDLLSTNHPDYRGNDAE